MRWSRIFCCVLVFASMVDGQTTLTFDAASVKRAGRILRPTGGPGTNDPGRIRYPSISLKDLVKTSYSAKDYELTGPSWMDTETFAVDATMPPDTTQEQFRVMLQNLLAERFKLTVHRESRDISGYSLVVAKNGPKMHNSGSGPATARSPDDDLRRSEGAGGVGLLGIRVTMTRLADKLSDEVQRPVIDATGLKTRYDFELRFRASMASSPEAEDLPDIFSALQGLGLKLEPAKGSVSVIVIDHVEKAQTEN